MKTTINVNGKNVEIELTKEQIDKALAGSKPKFWEPIEGEKAWYLAGGGDSHLSTSWGTGHTEHTEQGNVFKTKAEAELESKRREARYTLKKRIFELNDGWVPDWRNRDECKHTVGVEDSVLCISYYYTTKYHPSWMYLKSRRLAEQLISEMRVELKLVLEE